MLEIPTNRKARRAAAMAGAALTATALTAAITPPAAPTALRSLDVNLTATQTEVTCDNDGTAVDCWVSPMYTSGLASLVPLLLRNSNPYGVGFITTAYDFQNVRGTKALYDAVNGAPYYDYPNNCDFAAQDTCRTTFMLSDGLAAQNVIDAVNALKAAPTATPTSGYDPLADPPTGNSGLTNVVPILLNSPQRADGGIYARFGIGKLLEGVGETGPNAKNASVLSSGISVTWAYHPLGDFPVTLNPLSILNSAFAGLPPAAVFDAVKNYTGATKLLQDLLTTANGTNYPTNVASVSRTTCNRGTECVADTGKDQFLLLGILASGPGFEAGTDTVLSANYGTLPILNPTTVLPNLVNPLLTKIKSPYLLGNPLGDVLTPATKILVNMGYNDVITPDELDTIDTSTATGSFAYTFAEEGYQAYDRTFYQTTPETPVKFGWLKNPGMTPEQTKTAYGDAFKALGQAIKDQAAKPFFGILVKNPATAKAVAARTATAPAASEATPASVPAGTPSAATARTGAGKDKPVSARGHARASRTAK